MMSLRKYARRPPAATTRGFSIYQVGDVVLHFLSDKVDPGKIRTLYIPDGLRYFNRDVYRAAFALPNFLAERLAKGK